MEMKMSYRVTKGLSFDMDSQKSTVMVRLGEEEVRFSMTYYKKGKNNEDISATPTPFLEFNEWIKTKSQTWQKNIFDCMVRIRNIIDEENDVTRMLTELSKVYRELYSQVDMDEIKLWIQRTDTPVHVSAKPPTRRAGSAANNTREKTYTYEDYLELVVYSFACRFVAPVWGEINNRLSDVFGKDSKELYSMEVLHGTQMIDCQAERRLKEYLHHIRTPIDMSNVLINSLSEEDFFNHMFAVIVLKKIALGDISGQDNEYSLIAIIYFYFHNRLKQAAKGYGNDSTPIQRKKDPTDIMGNENKSQSIWEIGFSRSKFMATDKVALRLAMADHPRIISVLCPDLPPELYHESMDNLDALKDMNNEERMYMKPIQDVQLTIIRWVLDDVVNTSILDFMELSEVVSTIGLVRAILWHWGFYEFAAIVSGISIPNGGDEVFIGRNYKRNIDPALNDELNKLFPLGGQTRSEKRNMSVIGCIEIIEKGISDYNWRITLPDSWLVEGKAVELQRDGRRYIPNPNLRTLIGEFMKYIAARDSSESEYYHLFK